MISATGLQKAHGARTLFHDVTIAPKRGQRIALVGGNGAGKTTLLEILLGIQDPDGGEVHRPKGIEVGYLPQDIIDDPQGTVLEEVMAGAGNLAELAQQLAELEQRLGDVNDPNHDQVVERYGDAQSRFEQLGGYALESEAHRILAGLGFRPADSARPARELSGGWRMRMALARLLLSKPDVLILDEPTNHLDVDSVGWLEAQLAAWPESLLFVSHDRDFIDGVANQVIELSGGTAIQYAGGFAEFVVAREARIQAIEAAAAQQQRKLAHTERFIERFRYKATKAKQVQSRIKALEKIEAIEVPGTDELKARFAFPPPPRSSRIVAELTNVEVRYPDDDKPVLSEVDLVVERGSKIALVGPNGAGKTTLVKLLVGELEPTVGSVALGANVQFARFEQHQADELVPTRTVYHEFESSVAASSGRNLRTVLGSFGFPGDAADRLVGDLSGGECTRLALAKVLADPVNLLLLDEPTNHLDLPSCDLLEDALSAYPGTVILVTHDRHLIRGVAESLVEVRDGMAVQHLGVDEAVLTPTAETQPTRNISPAAARSGQSSGNGSTRQSLSGGAAKPGSAGPSKAPSRAASDKATSAPGAAGTSGTTKSKAQVRRDSAESRQASNKVLRPLRQAMNKVERQWEAAEARVADIQAQLGDPALYENPDEVERLSKDHHEAKDRAAELFDAWERAVADLEAAEQGR
jgi:ATP-binding cassette subfamily F protein 3